MSGEHSDQIAPIETAARQAITDSGPLGRIAQTRSPGRTPQPRRVSASEAARSATSPQLISPSPRSERKRRAGASRPLVSTWRQTWSAQFRVAPSNHLAPGMILRSMTRVSRVAKGRSQNSMSEVQKPSRSVVDHSHSAS